MLLQVDFPELWAILRLRQKVVVQLGALRVNLTGTLETVFV
jgi:hypothetical protein